MAEDDRIGFILRKYDSDKLILDFARHCGIAGSALDVERVVQKLLNRFTLEDLDARLHGCRDLDEMRQRADGLAAASQSQHKGIESLKRWRFQTKVRALAIIAAAGLVGYLGYESIREWLEHVEKRADVQLEEIRQLGTEVRLGLDTVEKAQKELDRQSEVFGKRVRDIESVRMATQYQTYIALLQVEAEGLMEFPGDLKEPDPLAAERSMRLYQLLLREGEHLMPLKRQADRLFGANPQPVDDPLRDQSKIFDAFHDFFEMAKELSSLRDERASANTERGTLRRLHDAAPNLVNKVQKLQSGEAMTVPLPQDVAAFWKRVEGFGNFCHGVAAARLFQLGNSQDVAMANNALQQFQLAFTKNGAFAWVGATNCEVIESSLAEIYWGQNNSPAAATHRDNAERYFIEARGASRLPSQLAILNNNRADTLMSQGYDLFKRARDGVTEKPGTRAAFLVDAFKFADDSVTLVSEAVGQSPTQSNLARATRVQCRCLQLLLRFFVDDPKNAPLFKDLGEDVKQRFRPIQEQVQNEKQNLNTDFGRTSDKNAARDLFKQHLEDLTSAGATGIFEKLGARRDNFLSEAAPTISVLLRPEFADLDVKGGPNRTTQVLDAAFPPQSGSKAN
jgi:hypothetical protein